MGESPVLMKGGVADASNCSCCVRDFLRQRPHTPGTLTVPPQSQVLSASKGCSGGQTGLVEPDGPSAADLAAQRPGAPSVPPIDYRAAPTVNRPEHVLRPPTTSIASSIGLGPASRLHPFFRVSLTARMAADLVPAAARRGRAGGPRASSSSWSGSFTRTARGLLALYIRLHDHRVHPPLAAACLHRRLTLAE